MITTATATAVTPTISAIADSSSLEYLWGTSSAEVIYEKVHLQKNQSSIDTNSSSNKAIDVDYIYLLLQKMLYQ